MQDILAQIGRTNFRQLPAGQLSSLPIPDTIWEEIAIAEADRPTERQEADERVDRIREHFQPSDYLLLVRLALFLEKWTVDMNELIEYTNTFNLPTIHYLPLQRRIRRASCLRPLQRRQLGLTRFVYGELRPLQRRQLGLTRFVYGELRPLQRRQLGLTRSSTESFVFSNAAGNGVHKIDDDVALRPALCCAHFLVPALSMHLWTTLKPRSVSLPPGFRPLVRPLGRRHLFVLRVTTLVRVREKTKGGQHTYAYTR